MINLNLREILGKEKSKEERTNRLMDSATAKSTAYVEEIRERKRNAEERLQDMLDITAETDNNAGAKAETNDSIGKKVVAIHKVRLELSLIDAELTVAENTHGELLGK